MQVDMEAPRYTATAHDVANRLGYSLNHARFLVNAGVVQAKKIKGRWKVDEQSLDRLAERMRQSGESRLDLMSYPRADAHRTRNREQRRRDRAAKT